MTLIFEPLDWPAEQAEVVAFLTSNIWPFHASSLLTAEDAAGVRVHESDVATYWIRESDETVGLIRLLDIDDLDDGSGSPLFDLRIAEQHRGRGLGCDAVRWLTHLLFTSYTRLHRIEATTRDDNFAMQTVFSRCGYRLEGRMAEAWLNADRTRNDALTYAILRREHND